MQWFETLKNANVFLIYLKSFYQMFQEIFQSSRETKQIKSFLIATISEKLTHSCLSQC